MVKTVTIYLEGGGDSEGLKRRCREGFRKLFQNCELKRMPEVIECGGRGSAFDRFCTAHNAAQEEALLLVKTSTKRFDPGEITAISRWSRSAPPVHSANAVIRSRRDRSASLLASLRDANPILHQFPVVALRLPPANGSNPFGVNGGAQ